MPAPATPPAPSLALGTWALAGDDPPGAWGYGPCDPQTARATVRAALEAGCRSFDTASLFGGGAVESLLGAALAGRTDVTITTRIGCRLEGGEPVPDFAPAALRAQAEAAARRLGRVPDRLLLHLPAPAMLRDGRALAALFDLKAGGLAREIGASVQEPEEALGLVAAGVDWVCVPYGPANRKFEGALFPEALARGVRVRVREALHNGRLTDRPRDPATFTGRDVRRPWPPFLLERLEAIRGRLAAALPGVPVEHIALGYALGHPAVAEVAVGCRGPGQVAANLAARPLAEAERARVNAALYSGTGAGA
jgi:aryl-alcohol dehydrogenase-like predicted oxidoreductase